MATRNELEQKYFPSTLSPGVPNWDDAIVIPHVDGEEYFAAIADAIDQCQGAGDRIYIASWMFKPDMALRTAAGAPLLNDLLVQKAGAGVDVRVIVATPRYMIGTSTASPWDQAYWIGLTSRITPLPPIVATNIRAARALRAASSGGGTPLKDTVLMDWGGWGDSRHEKTTIVYVASTNILRAFVGGMDFRIDRMADEQHATGPWHDVGVEIRAGAAAAMTANFVTRWEETRTLPSQTCRLDGITEEFNPSVSATPPTPPSQPPEQLPTTVPAGQYLGAGVRAVRSYDTVRAFEPYWLSPHIPWKTLPTTGIQEVRAVLQNAIGQASKYIYVEDQGVNPGVEQDYGPHTILFPLISQACAKGGVKVIFVVPGAGPVPALQPSLTMSTEITRLILNPLTAAQRQNFALFYVRGTVVHAKVVLVDDEFASIGSANLWDRSMVGVESELNAAIVHPGDSASLVADLRVRLWRGHMRVAEDATVDADLRDLTKSLGFFRSAWGTGVSFAHPNSALTEITP
jgi:phosphatidylserine/phosphatidylglycerophosphate/cardiolipin synthase-like enzyme